MAFTYSIEQSNIADAVKRRSNVMVNAVAGSGKTTTIKLLIETINPDYAIVLMYNKTLCEETKKRMGLLINRSNIIVSTIHGSATRLYGTVCKNDITLDNAILMSGHSSQTHRDNSHGRTRIDSMRTYCTSIASYGI